MASHTITKQVWPSSFPPKEDELLSSWLVRLAHAHLLKVHTFCDIICPKTQIWNRDVDLNPPPVLIAALSRNTMATDRQISGAQLASYEGIIQEKINHRGLNLCFLPIGIYHRTRKINGQMYCPGCLMKDGETPYYRKRWRLALSVVCVDCRRYLEDKCPHCGASVCFFRQELGHKSELPSAPITFCFSCRKPLATNRKIKRPSDALVDLQKHIDETIELGYHGNIQYSHLFFEGLSAILAVVNTKSKRAAHFQRMAAKGSATRFIFPKGGIPGRDSANTFNRLPIRKRASLLLKAKWLLADWPQNMETAISPKRGNCLYLMKEFFPLPFWLRKVVSNY